MAMPAKVRAAVLHRAADILGGPVPLGRYLNVSATLVALWISGSAMPPTEPFLKAVDVIEAERIAALGHAKRH